MDDMGRQPLADAAAPHHEKHDVNVRAIFWFGVAFIVMAIVIHLLLYFMFVGFRAAERGRRREPVTLVAQPGPPVPPEPRLQPFPEKQPKWEGARQSSIFNTPVDDMRKLREQEGAILGQYGWTDRSRGVVRIPIERAMELVVQRGLPVRPPPEGAPQ